MAEEDLNGICADCGVAIGALHEIGYDWEECPFCRGQIVTCTCRYEKLGLDWEKEPVASEGLNDEQNEKWEATLNEKGRIPFGNETRFD